MTPAHHPPACLHLAPSALNPLTISTCLLVCLPSVCRQVFEVHRFELSSVRADVVDTSWRLLSTALRDAGHALTAHPASTGARFRLLHLALRYCRAQEEAARGKPCPLPVVLLYEQVSS